MKIIVLLSLVLLIPSALAISTDMLESYAPRETMIIEIAGNILEPISPEDIELKRNNVQVPWEYGVKRLDNRYFLWGILPSAENTYTLNINGVTTTVNGQTQEINFNQSFLTVNETIPYSIKPGFAIAQSDTLEFNLFLNRDFPEPITINFPEEQEFTLLPGQNNLEISLVGVEQGLHFAQIGIYQVPIEILKAQKQSFLPKVRFFPKTIESVILINEEPSYPFSIINDQEIPLEGIVFEYDSDFFYIEPQFPVTIGPKETLEFTLFLINQNEPIDKNLILRSGDLIVEFPVDVTYTENSDNIETPYLEEEYSETQAYYCSEINGKSCSADEVCSIETVNTLDVSNCCIGSCGSSQTDSSSSLAWVGYLIGIVVLIIVLIVAGRYIKTRKQKGNPLKRKAEEAEINKAFKLSSSKKL